jgi:hypothetical protein
MRRYPIRRFFARTWLWVASFMLLSVGLTVLVLFLGTLHHSGGLLLTAGAATFSVVITHTVLRGAMYILVWLNGGPFRTGDTVQILVGPHQGKITCVYKEWKERNQVRVDLGDEAQRKVEDVFSYVELKKASSTAPTTVPFSDLTARSSQD